MSLLPVQDALNLILQGAAPARTERVPLIEAPGRVLAEPLVPTRSQPPFNASAMDGYAVRAADIAICPAPLTVIGEAAAGHAYDGTLSPGEAVRIFTGAPVPDGADTILIQENTHREGQTVTALEPAAAGRFIRPAGLDFSAGTPVLSVGHRLAAADIALAAATNAPELTVYQKPVIAILATGDELVAPGGTPGPSQIIASNTYGIAAMVREAGGTVMDLGIVIDEMQPLQAAIARARDAGADVLVTIGGASVGDHDLVQDALKAEGTEIDFWRIAMRPGKPLMFGQCGKTRVLGLPGNPVSSLVCTLVYLLPLVAKLAGQPATEQREMTASLGRDVPENDKRQEYMRASLHRDEAGQLVATPFDRQDSAMLSLFARADALVIRPAHAKAAKTGDPCKIIRLK